MITDFHFIRPWWLLALVPLALLVRILHRREDASQAWHGIVAPHLLPFLPDVVACNGRFSAGRMRQAAQHPNGGCLASPIRTEKAKYRSRSNGKGNFPHRLNVAKMLAQPIEHDHWFIHFRRVIAMAEQDLQPGNVPLEVSA